MRTSAEFSLWARELNTKYGTSQRKFTDLLPSKKAEIEKLIFDPGFAKKVEDLMNGKN